MNCKKLQDPVNTFHKIPHEFTAYFKAFPTLAGTFSPPDMNQLLCAPSSVCSIITGQTWRTPWG